MYDVTGVSIFWLTDYTLVVRIYKPVPLLHVDRRSIDRPKNQTPTVRLAHI